MQMAGRLFGWLVAVILLAGSVAWADNLTQVMTLLKKAEDRMAKSKYVECVSLCSKAIELEPKLPVSYVLRATAYNFLAMYQKAIDDCNTVQPMDPSNLAIYLSRGTAYNALQRYAEAEADFKKALELKATSEDALFGLAESQEFQGRRRDAIDLYSRFLATAPPSHPRIGDAMNKVRTLKPEAGSKS